MTTSLYKDTVFNELRQRTIQWALDRGIIEHGTAWDKALKVIEGRKGRMVDGKFVKM